ncbi:MAG: gephyrin-like molybdotransferase Glp [Verrucomicrobiales bacterium]
MIDEVEAIERILSFAPKPEIEEVDLVDASGRYLLEELRATVAVPGFDQSAMDGYALRSKDLGSDGGHLRISGLSAAGGGNPGVLEAGEAMRIFTGAPLPEGCDAVVMQENTLDEGGKLIVNQEVKKGECVHRKGDVICRGQLIASPGDRLNPGLLGLIASQGYSSLRVAGWPRAAVITTGDELVDPAVGALEPGQIFNSNASMLQVSLRRLGIQNVDLYHVDDQLQTTIEVIRMAMQRSQLVLIVGGVSVGGRDQVKPALEECGVNVEFWRVRIKPGKPLLYASFGEDGQLFGLPGNPVSALVTFAIFVLPAVQRRLGACDGNLGMRRLTARSLSSIANPSDRPHYVRGIFDGDAGFLASACQTSHNIMGLAQSNALARIAARTSVSCGDRLTVFLLWED